MTERLHPSTPHIATPTQSVFNAAARPFTKDALPPPEPLEEEPYTIKCICDYSDDDGNTIYCETCDTWQHIECFYHGNVEEASRDDFNHFCADCKPRVLDRRKATERQRQQREDRPMQDSGEKKTKRPLSKSHKKKPKPSDLQINGYHDHDAGHSIKAGSPVESHGKKSKTHHKSHHSISSQVIKRSPPHHNRTHSHAHPPSPATTPPDLPDHFRIHSYSKQLENTLDNDPGSQDLRSNSFASLAVTDTMSLWLRDPEKLRTDAGVDDFLDVFQKVKPDINLPPPSASLRLNSKDVLANDKMLQLLYLTVDEPLGKSNLLVGELKGFVDFQKNYYEQDPISYARLCHPAPFVFFHPRLPIYIDTRREGSQCRYIRRSCRSNTTLDTYITKLTEYHFCVVNDRPLVVGEQITLPWTFQFKAEISVRYLHLLGLAEEDSTAQPEINEVEYSELTELIDNVLSDFGGCACGLGADCAFARFHRNFLRKPQALSNGARAKKGRKVKQHLSPTSTGHATNSRDASEGQQEPYDGEDDSRSTSGSIQGKPRSRDMTPSVHVLGDSNRIDNEHVSEREKRKLMDIEKTFEKMDQAQPPRKKKRTSDGPISSGGATSGTQKQKKVARPSLSNPLTQVNGSPRTYKDAGTSRQQSDSPSNAQSPMAITPARSRAPSHYPSVPLRLIYRDASTQTDQGEDTWFCILQTPTPKKKFIPLNKRLLNSQLTMRMKREATIADQAHAMIGVEIGSLTHVSSPKLLDCTNATRPGRVHLTAEVAERPKSSGSSVISVDGIAALIDTPMPDAPISVAINTDKLPPPPWPGAFTTPSNPPSPAENRPVDLRVQMPPNPLQLTNGSQTIPVLPSPLATPSSAGAPMAPSPFSSAHLPPTFSPSVANSVAQPQPNPVKKKLSLNEYKARFASNKASSNDSDSTPVALKPSSSLVEDSKGSNVLEGPAIVDSPVAEKKEDPMALAGSV